MTDWKYESGHLITIDDPLESFWGKETDFDKVARKAGYDRQGTIGEEFSSAVTFAVYANEQEVPETGFRFLIDLSTDSTLVDNVYIDSLPNYLLFLREYAPLTKVRYNEER